jgi:mRNA-degrading endonuclease RelE of RelBE toxin-antitoxin system
MPWTVRLKKRVEKQVLKLPRLALAALYQLMREIERSGPVRGEWPNYSRLDGNRHHCHLKKGKPTYVAVWIEEKETVTVEIVYAGTHEKAPY